MTIFNKGIPFSKNVINNLFYKRTFVLKKIACFIIALCLTSALFSQVAPWGDCSMIDNQGTNCAPPNCPPLNTVEARTYRGTQLDATGCPISTTPGDPIAPPTITCPVKSIDYSIIEPTTAGVYRQYRSFAAPSGNDYSAKSQGWINQLFCQTDAFGLPAPPNLISPPDPSAPTGTTFIVELEGEESNLLATEEAPLEDVENAQLIQFDFWLLLPPTVPTVGIQIGDERADATALMVGPNLNNMCPVAEFIEVEKTGGVWVGYGNRTGYYTIPATGVSQACNANILRARLYITDINSLWNSMPLIDIGNGFETLTNLPVIAATSGDDNTIPTPVLKSEGTGYVDANGNVFDINGNWIPVACQTPGTVATDIDASTVGLSGTTSICPGDPAPNYTINGAPGSMITYNINGGTDIVITLDATTGTATIPASNTASSTFNLVSVNFDNGNSCDLSSTASVTVNSPPTCSITGSTVAVENAQNAPYMGPAGMASYVWSIIGGDATIDGSTTSQNVSIDFGTSNSTLQLTIIDGNGCTSTCTQIVTMTSSLTCMISGNTSTCANTTGLTFTGIAGATTYAWTVATGDATIVGAANAQLVTVNAGTNDFTLQLVISPGAVTTCTRTVTVNPLPTCSITGAEMAVENTQDVEYTGPAGMMTYAWSVIAGDAAIDGVSDAQNVNIDFGTNNSTLQLTITDANGCTSTCTEDVDMTVPPLDCTISGPGSTCANTTGLTFSGIAGADSHDWTISAGDATIVGAANETTVTVNAGATDFTLQLVISPGGVTTCTQTVTVNPLPTCSIIGPEMTVENTQDALYMGPAGLDSYAWSVIAGDAVIDGVSDEQNVSIDFGTSNSTLQLTIIDGNGCTSTCTQVVTMTSSLTCMISGPTSTCANTAGLVFAGIAGATSYAWTVATGDAIIVGAANAQMVTVNAGANDFTLQLVISPGTVTTCTQIVTVNPPPICSIIGAAFAVKNAQDVRYTGPAGMTYAWSVIAGDAVIDGVSDAQSVNIDFGANNSTLQLTITDGNSCTTTCTQEVTMIFPPTCMLSGPTSTCTNTTGLTFSGIAGADSYAWTISTGDATIVGAANEQMVTVNAGANDFTLQLVISPGTVTTCTQTVTVSSPPTCSIAGSTMAVGNSQDVLYMGPAEMTSYAWSVIAGDATIDGSNSSQNVSIDFGTSNSILQLTIIDGNGCTSTCTFNITVTIPIYTWTFLDPCNCNNPDNITLADGTFLFADFIRVDASQYTNPMVSLSSADANFLDKSGVPIDATTATFVSQGGGIFILPYYTRTDVPGSFVIDVNGDQQAGTSITCSPCKPTIPTLSQWGLLIYSLLILNLFVGVLYRKGLVFK